MAFRGSFLCTVSHSRLLLAHWSDSASSQGPSMACHRHALLIEELGFQL